MGRVLDYVAGRLARMGAKSVGPGPTDRPTTVVAFPGSPSWQAWNFQAYARLAYGANPYVYRGIRMLATALGGLPWYWETPDGGEVDRLHPGARLLRQPNPGQSLPEYFEALVSSLLLDGNSYPRATLNGAGVPWELYVLPPDLVQVVPGQALGEVAAFVYDPKGRADRILPDGNGFMVARQFKLWSPVDPVYGQSPLAAAASSVDTDNATRDFNRTLLKNGAVPGLTVTFPAGVEKDEDTADEITASLREYTGAKRAGKSLLLWGGASVGKAGFSPQELLLDGLAKLSAKEVAITLGVPPQLLGDTESQTYSNYQEARKALYMETVLPLADVFAAGLSSWLGGRLGDVALRYDRDEVEALREDQDKLWTRMTDATGRGVLTPNEAREVLGYESAGPEGDVLIVMGAAATLESIVGTGGLTPDEVTREAARAAAQAVAAGQVAGGGGGVPDPAVPGAV